MLVGISKGLKHMPVTKSFLIMNMLIPVIASLLDIKYAFYLKFDPFIYQWHQYWRLLTNQISFSSESQVFFSTIILFNLRTIERLQSPNKFASFLISIFLYNIVLQLITNTFLKVLLPDNWNFLQSLNYASGPLPVIGALLYEYSAFIPVVYKFELTDIIPGGGNGEDNEVPQKTIFSDKIFTYILCLQLSLSEGMDSFVPMFNGWVLGFLVSGQIIPGKNWRLPYFTQVRKYLYKNTRIVRPNLAPTNNSQNATGQPENSRQATPESDTEPVRPLATQFLDSFRR
ncbi:Dsc2 protein [Saccharomycopsis crataegensis]|uniref:Dsc2 protein n=1 Tax=Saccharomycopsis crataegensis TaxID=43959 RepID=A0AAV5QTY6_9ASCO|nr:Dsc2 protein [Saccharomycopsis crataegensis]